VNSNTPPRRASTAPVKPDLLDFLRKPNFATFARCFPIFSSGEKPGTPEGPAHQQKPKSNQELK
jgi:hypothetical protein